MSEAANSSGSDAEVKLKALARSSSCQVKPEHFHTKTVCYANRVDADMPATDDTDCFPRKIKTAQSHSRESAGFAYPLVGVNNASRERKQERESEFSDGLFAVGGDICHGDAVRFRRCEVDVVKTG